MRKWECTKSFFIIKGPRFTREQVIDLVRSDIRQVGTGPDGEQAFSFFTYLQAEKSTDAIEESREMLDEILEPYGVEIFVYESSARVVRPGSDYLRR
jgi:hypothetical protein